MAAASELKPCNEIVFSMDYTAWQEIQNNEVVRKRLAKRIGADCFRDGDVFENFHSELATLDNDVVKEIMIDAVNRTHVFLSKLSNAMGDMIVERLKKQDYVPGWDDPEDAHLFGRWRGLPCRKASARRDSKARRTSHRRATLALVNCWNP